jgi:hypothetical protein
MGATITRMDVVDKILITCTGVYHPDQGGYDRNLVVIGRPLGTAR